MTLARTPSMMLWTRGFSDCWDTANSASSSGRPALTSVASWRVNSERSEAEMPRRSWKPRCRLVSPCLTSATVTGSSCRSRRICRTCLMVSPSTRPFCSRPAVSSAVYSKAPISDQARRPSILARHAQDFLERGLAAQHLVEPVIADRRRHGARVFLECVLGRAIVDHGAHLVVDHHHFVDAGTAAETGAGIAGLVENGRGLAR